MLPCFWPIILSACLLSACLPIPHHQRRSPAISGVLRQARNPLGGVSVWMEVNPPRRSLADSTGPCRGRRTVTGEDGAFSFRETSEFVYFLWMGDRLDVWTLCFELPDQRRVIWTDRGYWGGPKIMEVHCDASGKDTGTGARGFVCDKTSRP